MDVRDRGMIKKVEKMYQWLMRQGEWSKMYAGAGHEEKKRKERKKVDEWSIHFFSFLSLASIPIYAPSPHCKEEEGR